MLTNNPFLAQLKNICEAYAAYPLANRSTFKIGGQAEFAAFPKTQAELCALIKLAKTCDVRARVFGNASNILFSSEGVSGLVIFTNQIKEISLEGENIRASCGVKLSSFCNLALKNELSGAEFAFGIPGTVGGAVYMNAGAHGGEISHILVESTCLDMRTGETLTLSASEHCFAYRTSVFEKGELLVLSSLFKLRKGTGEEIEAKMKEYTEKRKASQPLTMPSAGSVFKRPAVGFSGKYIEDAGLKGYKIGGAQVSEKHAGFIVNAGGATSCDVLALIEKIKTVVSEKFGVMLETEIIYVE
ncbi:MAG: UDP-N-acetylmuramate dehydrogenase [Clostridia bacterium]|nr:UDP-N-acetylmuramate dehydrogenase [Clostridia bacterium]